MMKLLSSSCLALALISASQAEVSAFSDIEPTCRTVTLDPSVRYQTMAGFGASDCWSPAFVGKNWDTARRDSIATLLFDQNLHNGQAKGIGLSMWRVNLGGGSVEQGDSSGITVPSRRAECYLDADGNLDWNKCAGQRFWMEKARTMGVEKFVLFSVSPLVCFTYNGQARSDRGATSNLRPEHYDDFAGYLADVALHFKNSGFNITHISPFNEPQYNWDGHGQEGSGWSIDEQARIVRALDTALTDRQADIDILPGEATDWMRDVMPAYYSPKSSAYIGNLPHVKRLFGAHSYWTDCTWDSMRSVRENVAATADSLGVEVWQTEWSMMSADNNYDHREFPGYADGTEIDHSIHMSRVIHNDITVGGCTCWSYWTSMDHDIPQHKNRFVLIRLTPEGDDISQGDGTFHVTTNLWVLGNYSLFVRPGFVRIRHDMPDENHDFFGSSYISPDGKRIVSVYTNSSGTPCTLHEKMDGRENASVRTFTTSATQCLEKTDIPPQGNIVLPPSSVVTVVYDF